MSMKVKHVMTSEVVVASPDDPISEAARRMAEFDMGALPVGENDRLVGVITDRDIALRAVARRLPPETKVREVMSREVLYCFDEEDVEHVARNMADQQIRRLPVVNRDKRLVGIVSLADLARSAKARTAGEAVAGISRPGGRHDQTLH
jgi:CBS domain-containing protein